ncbi:DUF2834 domain-containing protein [Alteromonas hispanica]|uniref:DUF2834 domain-containing protein n=1 Tax=Alteromonas hispanica TaxID=315421 RepID=A0A6L9MVR3_9ALTE|nr:DUF2834 domain-containing protein [Alteromonas hispanica]NDW22268.1 DUF2834 domain-containing protein [Alteromonas hispanica]
MSRKTVAITLLIPFSILTAYAVVRVGIVEIFTYHLRSPAGWQVFTDLVVALIIVLIWLIPDARKNNRNPWPWVIATICMGSIGPLLYLATETDTIKNGTRHQSRH